MEKNQNIKLPPPSIDNEYMKALQTRASRRDYDSTKELTPSQLSGLLWSAYGNNREHEKRTPHTFLSYKTVASTCAAYPFTIYVFFKSGIYKYDTENNELIFVKEGDYMEKTGGQDFVKNASVNLYWVCDYTPMKNHPAQRCNEWFHQDNNMLRAACFDAGISSHSVYMYCETHGLKTCVRGWAGDVQEMKKVIGCDDQDHEIILAQSVGV